MNGMGLELDMYEHRGLNEVFFWKGEEGRGSVMEGCWYSYSILFEEGGGGEGDGEVEMRRGEWIVGRVLGVEFCFV